MCTNIVLRILLSSVSIASTILVSLHVSAEIDVIEVLDPEQEASLMHAIENIGIESPRIEEYEVMWRHIGGHLDAEVVLDNGDKLQCISKDHTAFSCIALDK